jgi:hypothetical protein
LDSSGPGDYGMIKLSVVKLMPDSIMPE